MGLYLCFKKIKIAMSIYEEMIERKEKLKLKLASIVFNKGEENAWYWSIANELKISGTTVSNYISGNIADGFLGEAICKTYLKLKKEKT